MATVSFSPSINLNNGTIALTDTSDYVGQGIALIDVNGNFKITAPSGNVIWDSGLNYYFETGTAQGGSTSTMQLAVGATSLNIANYYILFTGGAGSGQVARIASYNATTKLATFVTPVGVAANNTTTYKICLADIFVAANTTTQPTISLYSGSTIEQGTYTIDYLVYNSDTGEYYTSQSTVDYQYTLPTVVIQQVIDCLSPLLTSVDATDYTLFGGIQPDSLTRTHTIIYPPSTGVSNVVGGTANLYTSILYNNGTYTTTISTVVSWTLPDGTVINATLTGEQEKLVQCEQWVCDIYCCLKSLYNEWQGYISTNQTLATQYHQRWNDACDLATMIQSAYSCGDSAMVATYVNTLRTISNCNSGCSCDDGTIELIQGLGNITNTYDLDSGTPTFLYVTPTVSGNTTSWEVGLTNQAITDLTQGNVVTADTNTKVTTTGSGSTASYAVKGATVTAGSGIGVTFSGGTTNPDYAVRAANLLDSQYVDTATTGTTLEVLKTYTLPIGTVGSNGVRLIFEGKFSVTQNTDSKTVALRLNGTPLLSAINANQEAIAFVSFRFELIRKSTTLFGVVASYQALDAVGGEIYSVNPIPIADVAANDLSAATNVFTATGDGTVTGDIISKDFSIEYLGK